MLFQYNVITLKRKIWWGSKCPNIRFMNIFRSEQLNVIKKYHLHNAFVPNNSKLDIHSFTFANSYFCHVNWGSRCCESHHPPQAFLYLSLSDLRKVKMICINPEEFLYNATATKWNLILCVIWWVIISVMFLVTPAWSPPTYPCVMKWDRVARLSAVSQNFSCFMSRCLSLPAGKGSVIFMKWTVCPCKWSVSQKMNNNSSALSAYMMIDERWLGNLEMIKKSDKPFLLELKIIHPCFNSASKPYRLFQKWTNWNFRALNVKIVILENRLECVEKPNWNEERSFIDAVCIPGASRREQQGIHSHNWFSTRDLNTASRWQADNSANFSLHGLWMV